MYKHIYIFLLLTLTLSCSSAPPAVSQQRDIFLEQYRDPVRLMELIKNPRQDIRIIDVRSAEEYAEGHIPGAEHIPHTEITKHLADLPKNHYLIFYCLSGARVESVIGDLRALGYTRILNWGGIMYWPYELERSY